MRACLLILFVATICAAPTTSQASVTIIGTPCATPEGTATISTGDVPMLGGQFTVEYNGPNHLFSAAQTQTQPVFILGFDTLNVIIPPGFFPLQPAGCELLASHHLVVPMPTPDPFQCPQCLGYLDAVEIDIPNDPGLNGVVFFAQWLVWNRQCGFAGCDAAPLFLGASDTLLGVIGV